MKKFVFVLNAIELLGQLMDGRRVRGVLYMDKNTGCITFKADRQSKTRHKDVLMKKTPWGWLKASLNLKKRFTSVPDLCRKVYGRIFTKNLWRTRSFTGCEI